MNTSQTIVWCEASKIPSVEPSEIHVWRVNLACPPAEVFQLQNILSADEQKQAARFHFAHDQRRFVVRRAVLRQLLAIQLGLRPEAVRIESANFQKPKITGPENPKPIRFNCSHSADWALIAVAREREVGVDLEQHRQLADVENLAGEFFSAGENCELAGLSPALKLQGFFNCWTRKEAFVKAIGLGLSYPLNRFSVSLSPDRPAAILNVADDPAALEKWSMISPEANPDYSAALVFEGNKPDVKFFDWNSQLGGKFRH
jgi:4'-phosphopantetheinyl transferase